MPRIASLFLLCVLGVAFSAAAEPYAVGSRLPALTLPDQHGEARRVDESTRVVLFSREMKGGGVIRKALEVDGPALLEGAGAVYVADVSRMPGIIRSVIAKPRMRRRPYPMLLDEEGSASADFPAREGQATLLRLEGLRVTGVQYFDSPEALRQALAGGGERSGTSPSGRPSTGLVLEPCSTSIPGGSRG